MQRSNRVLMIAGLVMTQIMLLVAVFALGIYVGRYGLTREGLVYQAGPGGAAGPGGLPGRSAPLPGGVSPGVAPGQQGGGLPLPPGLTEPPQLIGRLLTITATALELATPQGPRQVLVDPDTTYMDEEGNTITLGDLEVGSVVGIYGEFGQDGRNVTAALVVILPPLPDGQGPPGPGQPRPPQP